MKHTEYKSNYVILRNTGENDLDFVVDLEREPVNAQYVGQWTKEQHRDAIFHEDILHLIVEEKATNKPVGYVIIAGLTSMNQNIELRRVANSEKGKGFGRKTLLLVKKIVFEKLNAHRLWLDVRYKNYRAQKLYIYQGFIQEGVLRECILYNRNYESLIVMSILKSEYTDNLDCV